jgi:hypothetical protein
LNMQTFLCTQPEISNKKNKWTTFCYHREGTVLFIGR